MLCMYHVAQKLRNETVSEQTATITVRADTQKTQQVAYLGVSMCFLDCFVQVKIQQSMKVRRFVLSIAQDVVFGVSEGKILTPKNMGLELSIHQATRPKNL